MEVLLDILGFPLWWYGKGLILALSTGREWLADYAQSLNLRVWFKNLFVPMYGYTDIQSRIISVFMRIAQLIGRGIAFFVLGVVVAAFVAMYIAIPVIVVIGIMWNLIGLYGRI